MLPTLDAKQRLRLRRFKMAMASYAMWVALAMFAYLTGKMDISEEVVPVILGGIVLTNLYFYVMIRSGFNKRLSDPSMTVQQLVIAFCWAMVLMLCSAELRGAMMMVYVITLLFGIFGLRRQGFYLISAFAIAGYLGIVSAEYALFPDRVDASREVITAMILTASVIWCAWFGSYVAGLKETLRQSNTELRDAVSSASRMATRDHLTQSFNRRYMMECLSKEKSRADRSGSTFAVCIFDLDHFKALNDRYGHLVGDEVLSAFAYLARQELRASDVIDLDSEGRCFGRFGGEEFMCLLPSTSEKGALKCAERLREATAEKEFRGSVRITLSAGVAEYVAGESVADTLRRADEALYFAKQSGRDRVACARTNRGKGQKATDGVVVKGNFSNNGVSG
ncbi:MAG: hypothetical protein AMJ59_09885 [Gammaproteobacteria bacterium SG8_31]|nr:MAG: hypothetical protein AMJ59_09885 [Gammaproteobacteria bacterium SG8_31]